jgi:hypothetical protein
MTRAANVALRSRNGKIVLLVEVDAVAVLA